MTSGLREQKRIRTKAAISSAALTLFTERGFEAVPIAEIAAAADVGERTVFRYFADKEELLFGGDEAMRAELAAALTARPPAEPPLTAVLEASKAITDQFVERPQEIRAREKIIRGSPALRAREHSKHAGYERVLAEGLADRGLGGPQARLLARIAVACFDEAVERWLGDRNPRRPGLSARLRQAYSELPPQLG